MLPAPTGAVPSASGAGTGAGAGGRAARPAGEGLEPLPGSRVGGDRREQRVVGERGDAAVAEVDRDLEPVERLARRSGEQEECGARGLQRPDRGVRRDQPVEDRRGAVGIAGLEPELGLPRGRDDRRHREEVARRRGHGGRRRLGRAGQGDRIAAGCPGRPGRGRPRAADRIGAGRWEGFVLGGGCGASSSPGTPAGPMRSMPLRCVRAAKSSERYG